MFCSLYSEEGKGVFNARQNVIGHMQQGSRPTPFDRNTATFLAAKAVQWLEKQINRDISQFEDKESACVLGLRTTKNLVCIFISVLK